MRLRVLLALVASCLVTSSAVAQIAGVGYRVAPTAEYVWFDGDAGLSDGFFYGGGGGLAFGEFVELNGMYLFGSTETDFSDLSGLEGEADLAAALAALPSRDVNVQRYGGVLKLNLAQTAIVPYVSLGTGLMRLGPDGQEASRSIYLTGGAGVQLTAADRFAVSVAAEALGTRLNLGSALLSDADLAATGLTRGTAEQGGDFNQVTVRNLGVRASVSAYLGGRRPGELSDLDRAFQRQFSGGLSGLSVVVEPFYGRVNFNDAFTAYRDQAFVGAEAGFDFGPLVGVRGFYGRGTDTSNPIDIQSIQMIGGDLRLRLSEGRGLVPFLSVGGGYLDVVGGYAEDEGATPENAAAEDNPFALAGAGIGFLVTPRLRGIAEVRGLLMSTRDEENVATPDEVYLSPMFRAGLSFGIGGRSGSDIEVVRQSEVDAERAVMEREMAELAATRDSVRAEIAALASERNAERARALAREQELLRALDVRIDSARTLGDSLAVARFEAEQADLRAQMAATEARLAAAPDSVVVEAEETIVEDGASEHMVTIPLPREGELYVRYGPPGGVVIDAGTVPEADLRAAVRAALIEVLAADPATSTLTEADVDAIEDRVVARLEAQRAPAAPAPTGVTTADLERMERRLEARLLREIRALRSDAPADGDAPTGGEVPEGQ